MAKSLYSRFAFLMSSEHTFFKSPWDKSQVFFFGNIWLMQLTQPGPRWLGNHSYILNPLLLIDTMTFHLTSELGRYQLRLSLNLLLYLLSNKDTRWKFLLCSNQCCAPLSHLNFHHTYEQLSSTNSGEKTSMSNIPKALYSLWLQYASLHLMKICQFIDVSLRIFLNCSVESHVEISKNLQSRFVT